MSQLQTVKTTKTDLLYFRLFTKIEFTKTCWLWKACTNGPMKYAWFYVGGRQPHIYAHRLLYELFKGPIPRGLTIDHLCRVPNCVNPNHLEAVTLKENLRRGTSFAAINFKKTVCINGHPYTEENTQLRENGRRCRICRQIQGKSQHRKYLQQKKERSLQP